MLQTYRSKMKNNQAISTALLTGCLLAGFALSSRATITANYQSNAGSSSFFDSFITTNLIQAGQSSLGAVTADASSLNGTFLASGLNDASGAANGNLTYYAAVPGSGSFMPNTAVFYLTAGYNITNIQVISGWGDHNLGEQRFQLLLSLNGGAFTSFGTFTNNASIAPGPSNPGSWMTTLTGGAGGIATNVTGIEFVFLNPDVSNGAGSVGTSQAGGGSSGGTVIHEVQVFGTFYANLNSQPTITANYQTNGSSSSFFASFITANLIQAGQSSLGSATADASSLNGTFLASGLNDGSVAGNGNLTYYAAVPGSGNFMPNTVSFQLTAGYNITNIQVISGWGDHNLGEQCFQLLLSLNGGAFTSYGTFTNNGSIAPGSTGPGSWMTTLTGGTGAIATNVTGIEFIFLNPDTSNGAGSVGTSQAGNGSAGGTVIHELQVFGTYYTNLSLPTVAVTDTNVLNGLTLNNWVRKTNYISSAVEGASLTVGFKDTLRVALQVDNRQLSNSVAARYPIIAWSVNGGPFQKHQLTATDSSVVLASGVTDPVIDLYIEGMSPFEDRYNSDVPPNAVKITGFIVDANASSTAVAVPGKVWLNIGDSIMAGNAALYAAGAGRPPDDGWAASDDARASYGYLLARHYGYQETRLAYGGYDWAGGLASVPALTTLIDQKTSTISRLNGGRLNPIPDVVLINLGENGAPALADVTNALVKLRTRVKPATKILVMVPVAGTARTQVTQAFNSYANSTLDTNAFLVDLGSIAYDTADGQHPTAQGHQTIYQDALPFLDPIIAPVIVQNTQYGTSSSAFDGAMAANLIQAGQSSLSSVTVSHGPSQSVNFTTAGLNDGSTAGVGNLTYYGNAEPSDGNLPVTITFNLNTNIATGYKITSIQAITGWSDSDLANQNFELLFSLNGGPFTSYGAFFSATNTDALNNGDNAILQTLTSRLPGPIASGVTGVQFVFQNPGGVQGGAGGTLIRELQVFGTPIVNLGVQTVAGNHLQLTWPQGVLLQATSVTGPWITNAAATSPYTFSPTAPQMYYRVRVQ
ncbi:MAG: hypothetical protein JWR26_115 [Pedosphaera sp.]|nr:hypothetical protein [Pedosphaera sp.]